MSVTKYSRVLVRLTELAVLLVQAASMEAKLAIVYTDFFLSYL